MSITVLIPTRNRSDDFLAVGLESVRQQTAFKDITKVIVSENSSNDASRKVCDRFPDLNISYVLQTEPMSFVDHMHWLFRQAETQYSAMLHDDDWWHPAHLQTALNCFKENADVVGYFSNFLFAKDEYYRGAGFHNISFFSYIKSLESNKFSLNPIYFDFTEIAALCYLYTPFHMSCMIVETEVMKHVSAKTEKISKPFNADRILYPYIAIHGKIAFAPQTFCGIRMHTTNLTHEINFEEKRKEIIECSEHVMHLAKEKHIDLIAKWKQVKEMLTQTEWDEVINAYNYNFGFNVEEGSPFYQVNRNGKNIAYLLKKIKKKLL
jgi:hypothetical protein